ncbi:MAG: NADH-quinone oxidoreductase subunit C [Egibacteraceae bacterium]
MQPTQLATYLCDRLGPQVIDTKIAYDQLTVTVEPEALPRAAQLCKQDPALRFDFFDFMAGVDEREAGFSVVTHLYSVEHRHHVTLRAIAPGGREAPRLPTLTGVYRGANWHEREAYDMFGIEFDGHPRLLPRILTIENFEGFPLRKDFLLTSREAKPWPGAKEPGESDAKPEPQPGTVGDTPIATPEDKAAAAKAKADRARAKAAAMRKKKAEG